MDWPDFDSALWTSSIAEAESQSIDATPIIFASDRDAGAIDAAHGNADRASVADAIEFSQRAVSAIEPPPGPGWIITNPPYGVRVSGRGDLRNLYAQLGHVLRAKCPGWQVAMLTTGAHLQRQTGLKFDQRIALVNGGLRVELVKGIVEY